MVRKVLYPSTEYARHLLRLGLAVACIWILTGRCSNGGHARTVPVTFYSPSPYLYAVPTYSTGPLQVPSSLQSDTRSIINPASSGGHGQARVPISHLTSTHIAWMPRVPPSVSGPMPANDVAAVPYSSAAVPSTKEQLHTPAPPMGMGSLTVRDEADSLERQIVTGTSRVQQMPGPPSTSLRPENYQRYEADGVHNGELTRSEARLRLSLLSDSVAEASPTIPSVPHFPGVNVVPPIGGPVQPSPWTEYSRLNQQPYRLAHTDTPFQQQMLPLPRHQPSSSSTADAYISPTNVAASALPGTMLLPAEHYRGGSLPVNPLTVAQIIVSRLILQDERFVHDLLVRHGPDLTDISTGEVVQALASSDPALGRLSQFFRRHLGPTLELLKDAHKTLVEPHLSGGEKRLEGAQEEEQAGEVAAHIVSFVENDPVLHTLSDIVVNRVLPGIEAFVDEDAGIKRDSSPAAVVI
ncbi:conserved hypothetical protein [Neospora caninum Liverpool]|uniref:Uncharacterized protein n=1 Tax=Neospora caninum (strain Liverpool) TaxID=572307 RepID=F0VBT5_NEOCL|nr:conserved hypothetical protein [Neospora caninum Liverpool]CBZ51069.1 conserved hypothetical protein [Neospora caninum Liverpool]CEL68376.1 TPA: hypothetical protein BN1204_041440 [Neospora caninum Liverpool]|eukprot:XP_003881102.1 conserved hypothetical protein [Neospora caninum Liverpool]